MNKLRIDWFPFSLLKYFGAFFYNVLVDLFDCKEHMSRRSSHIVTTDDVDDTYSQVHKVNINDRLLIAHQDSPPV